MGDSPLWHEFWSDLRPMARSVCVIVPTEVSAKLRRIGQARVRVVINGFESRTLMLQGPAGTHFVKLSASFRKAAGIQDGGPVSVRLALAEEEPAINPPPDFMVALAADSAALERWDHLPYRHKKAHIEYIENAGRPESRFRRIRKIIEALSG